MKKNINKTGSIVRAIIGIVSIALSLADFFEDSIVDNGLMIIGVILIVASIIQICPLFYFLGINTNKSKKVKMY
ncbi:heme/copper-type cytochrome/quinol oxidase subunit 4 [Flavobacterium arsenatis]|uniref:Heme/copper-type cytochrome/quinol oxidase subunit 4 n=1 Tax=Flavobacterium arsenatis TaxID=1484332 RepID=A0ABU1TR08_9FLAO|nr:DUF2892 domain-containing protein [Flavobacterium arsenatis]MDR6967807.1 heme/copper-type cytochrome/quinol oxidase subunit 4 [Flavobacterium arsenatis]